MYLKLPANQLIMTEKMFRQLQMNNQQKKSGKAP